MIEHDLQKLVVRHRDCEQGPVRFRPGTWRPWLEPLGAAHVLDIGTEGAKGARGHRLVTRDDLAELSERVGDDPDGLRDLFVAVMIWGSGTTNGRGPRHTSAALSDARVPQVLRTTREAVRQGQLGTAYRRFVLKGVGRSFFTKWFAAVEEHKDPDPTRLRALILDDRVFSSLNALGWSTLEAAGTRHWPTRYVMYTSAVHGWAASLGVTPERLEWLLFHLNGNVDERAGHEDAS